MSWANTVSHGKTSHKRGAPPKGGPSSEQSDQQSEITKIRQMLELVISENKKLKAELAQLKGTSADSTPPPSPCNLGQAAKKSGQPNQLAMPPKQSPQTPSENGSADAMDDSPLDSPPSKRRAKEVSPSTPSQPALSGSKKNADDDMLREFGENLSKTLNETLSAKFEAMLAQFAESMGTQIASLNARVTASENATLRVGRDGGTGPIKSTKPYFRPPAAESPQNLHDNV